jgi:signal transduction histidine kinase/ActR/RegA family two-component response regulator
MLMQELAMFNPPDYAALFDASPTPCLLIDKAFNVVNANCAYLQAFGKPADIIGQPLLRVLPVDAANPDSTSSSELTAAIEHVFTSKQSHRTAFLRYAISNQTQAGPVFEERFWRTVDVPLFSPDGEVAYVAHYAIDVTDEYYRGRGVKLGVTETGRAGEVLRDADHKDEFLARLAHELRNPLAPISAAAQLLKMPSLNADMVRKTSEVIGRQVSHMTSLVDDLLDVSRLTRGTIELTQKKLSISDIVADAIEQAKPLIQSKRQELNVKLLPIAVEVMGDAKRLVQVLTNLLNNASKFTPETGQLELTVTLSGEKIVIDLHDNGIGIPPEYLPQVFDLFTQAKRSPDRSQGGLGLGLALVRSLVTLHGGTVSASSKGQGYGSTFTIHLPRFVEQSTQAGPVSSGSTNALLPDKALRLLVVDDNTDAAEMLGAFMESAGHQVMIEHEPYQAIERAEIETPDVCLLDIGLPGMDGNQLARRLRLMPKMADKTLIAVTGYGKEFDRDASIDAGFDYYFVKPADPQALVALLDQIQMPL